MEQYLPPRVDPLYLPSESGQLSIYAGPLLVLVGGVEQLIQGRVVLDIGGRPELTALLTIPQYTIRLQLAADHGVPSITIPTGVELSPPDRDQLSESNHRETIEPIMIGDLRIATRIIGHVIGRVTHHPLPILETSSGTQQQLDFEIADWRVRLAAIDDERAASHNLALVFEAAKKDGQITEESVSILQSQIFLLLSLVAGQEVGITPLAGIDDNDTVVWVQVGPPRTRQASGLIRWCPSHLVPSAISRLSAGFESINHDAAFESVVDRAIQHLFVAGGPEVLDVRIPVLCSGLELLAWALLQREGWLTPDTSGQINAGARARLALRWAGIPIDIPDQMSALRRRANRLGQPMESPEIVFNVRNGLVHPPKKVDEPEWPSSDELLQTWQLAAWLLEMLILRVLKYDGLYWSRLRLGRSVWDTELVPWSTQATERHD